MKKVYALYIVVVIGGSSLLKASSSAGDSVSDTLNPYILDPYKTLEEQNPSQNVSQKMLQSLTSATEYLLGYIGSIDKLNALTSTFRGAVKVWYKTKGFFGFKGYDDLQNDFLYPPTGAVPPSVLQQLQDFNGRKVATAGVPEFNSDHAFRMTSDLGNFEKEFIQNRLQYARQLFAAGAVENMFISPDANLGKNPTPYGYALDTGLADGVDTPRIAVCYSGGGFRAMTATLGFWKALSDTGIVNSILYTANLSGSTWCSMPWCMGASLQELEATYEKYAKVGIPGTYYDIQNYIAPSMRIDYLKQKFTSAFLWEQPLSSVRGLYGPLLAQMVLSSWDNSDINGGTKQQSSQYLYLWQAKDFIANRQGQVSTFPAFGIRPFPVATALIPYEGSFSKSVAILKNEQKAKNGLWMEFNPEYVGFEYLDNKQLAGAWIPTFALGRKFEPVKEKLPWYKVLSSAKTLGYASTAACAQTVDYWAGTWGSAFAVSPGDIYRIFFGQNVSGDTSASDLSQNESSLTNRVLGFLGSVATAMPSVKSLKDFRLFPSKFNNFAVFSGSPITADTFTAVDAGIDYNLPFPPLLRPGRAIDLIIVGDWSEQDSNPSRAAKELLLAEAWAWSRGVPFPRISGSAQYVGVAQRPMTLFNEYPGGVQGPAILYIPLINNGFNAPGFSVDECFKGACSTFNFDYRNKQNPDHSYIKQLAGHVYRTVWGVYPQMREVVQELVKAKNAKQPFTMTKMSSLDELTGVAVAA